MTTKTITLAQKFALNRHGLQRHSMRAGWVISKAADGWVIISPNGYAEFHLPSLAVARAEIDHS